jgi:hypothetical protein
MDRNEANEKMWKILDTITEFPQTEESTQQFIEVLVDGFTLGLDILVYGIVTENDGEEYANPIVHELDITAFDERDPDATCMFCYTNRKYAEAFDNDEEVQNSVPTIINDGKNDGSMPYIYINKPSCISAGIGYLLDMSLAFGVDEEYIEELKLMKEEVGPDPLDQLFDDDLTDKTDFLIFNYDTDRQFVISVAKLADAVMQRMEETEENCE